MGIRHDVAITVDDDAGREAPLSADHQVCLAAAVIVDWPISSDEHLHDTG